MRELPQVTEPERGRIQTWVGLMLRLSVPLFQGCGCHNQGLLWGPSPREEWFTSRLSGRVQEWEANPFPRGPSAEAYEWVPHSPGDSEVQISESKTRMRETPRN